MKKVTKVLALVLLVVMLSSVLCACENTEEKMAELAGTWVMTCQDSEEQALALLENIELYEGEIAVVDLTSLRYAWIYEFDTEGNFRQAEDPQMAKALVKEFYIGAFDALYEHRADINALYEEADLSKMTRAEFDQFYADIYGFANFETLMNRIVESAYRYDEWEDLQHGTYTVRGSFITLNTEEDGMGRVGYEIEGDTLTLTYSDGTEVYTKSK